MKKIIFNGGSLLWKETFGVQRNTLEILKELDKIAEPGQYAVIVPKVSDKSLELSNIEVIKDARILPDRKSKFLWNNFRITKTVKKMGGLSIDTVLGIPLSGCDILMLYDCITELFPENANTFSKKLSRKLYIHKVKKNIKCTKLLLTDSQCAKNDLVRLYGAPTEKIQVIPCAWQHFERIKADPEILSKYNLNDKEYFFSLGSRYVHKNFKWVIEAARQNPQYTFVASGSQNLSSSDASLDDEMPSNLIFTGYLTDGEIKALMGKCKAFIQPSLYEGFGIPPMEAMSTGAKCIVANTSSLPEIYGNSVWYIDPKQYEGINMDTIMSSPIEENESILHKYSWKKSAETLQKVLKD